jgi:hypothetical protein
MPDQVEDMLLEHRDLGFNGLQSCASVLTEVIQPVTKNALSGSNSCPQHFVSHSEKKQAPYRILGNNPINCREAKTNSKREGEEKARRCIIHSLRLESKGTGTPHRIENTKPLEHEKLPQSTILTYTR